MAQDYDPSKRTVDREQGVFSGEALRVFESAGELFAAAEKVAGEPIESSSLYLGSSVLAECIGRGRTIIYQKAAGGESLSVVESGSSKVPLVHMEVMRYDVDGCITVGVTTYNADNECTYSGVSLQDGRISGGMSWYDAPSAANPKKTETFTTDESAKAALVIIGETASAIEEEKAIDEVKLAELDRGLVEQRRKHAHRMIGKRALET